MTREVSEPTKVCKGKDGCGQELPLSEFGNYIRYKDGLHPTCRECNNSTDRAYRARRYTATVALGEGECLRCHMTFPASELDRSMHYCVRCIRDRTLRSRYRAIDGDRVRPMTIDDQERMFAEQGGRCAICGSDGPRSKKGWCVDHCHESNLVRQITCWPCNVMLGNAQDDPAVLRAAADYLEQHAALTANLKEYKNG